MKPGEINKLTIKATLETIFGIEMVKCEHRFHDTRRFRFDYAIPEIKLAIEYNGHAGFTKPGGMSRHGSIIGMTNDAEKMNLAISCGWRVLTFTALFFKYNDRTKHNLTEIRETIMNTLAGMQNEKDEQQ